MFYFKLLEQFLIRIMFSKDEYNIKSKHFNPIRVITVTLLIINLAFTVFLIYKSNHMYEYVLKVCPDAFSEYNQKNHTTLHELKKRIDELSKGSEGP